MKKIKLVYNPVAGNRRFPRFLDDFIARFQQADIQLDIYRSMQKGDIATSLQGINQADYQAVFVAGGDGSVNEILNSLINNHLDIPLGIIPTGTANDFANYLNMPQDINKCFDIFLQNNLQKIDIGQVNQRYFINVCAGGLPSKVSQSTDPEFKNTLGKISYYLNGIKEIPRTKPLALRIKTREKIIEGNFYMFVILNSKGAGGFTNLAVNASISDGLFDFIGFRADNLFKLPTLLTKFFQGKHLSDENIIHFQADYFKIELLTGDNHFCDIDGERGPYLPLEIKVCPGRLTIFKP